MIGSQKADYPKEGLASKELRKEGIEAKEQKEMSDSEKKRDIKQGEFSEQGIGPQETR